MEKVIVKRLFTKNFSTNCVSSQEIPGLKLFGFLDLRKNTDYFTGSKFNRRLCIEFHGRLMTRPHILALLLPGYSPDLAWMARALNADRVILDAGHPFSRKSKVHRTKIRTPDGHQWLSIPFVNEDRRKPISRVRIDERRPWLKHHLRALEYNYRNSLYFDYYEPEIRADLETASEFGYLIEAVRHLMERQWIYLQLRDFPLWMSDTGSLRKKAGLPNCENLVDSGEFVIWQEPDSRHYQRPHPCIVHPTFSLPEYRQHFPGFVPGCGILDLLFEYGPDAWQILDRLHRSPA